MRKTHRHGMTLIEVIGMLSILLMISLAAASMLSTVTLVGLTGTRTSQTRADVARFAEQFRQDVHLANEVSVGDAAESIDLQMGDYSIRYQIRKEMNQLTRERTGSADAKAFERYELPEKCDPAFLLDADFVTARVTVVGARTPWLVEVTRP